MDVILEGISSWHRKQIRQVFASRRPTAYEVYNAATFYATHQTRSYRIAFDLLERINRGFQKHFSPLFDPNGKSVRKSQDVTVPLPPAPDSQPAHATA